MPASALLCTVIVAVSAPSVLASSVARPDAPTETRSGLSDENESIAATSIQLGSPVLSERTSLNAVPSFSVTLNRSPWIDPATPAMNNEVGCVTSMPLTVAGVVPSTVSDSSALRDSHVAVTVAVPAPTPVSGCEASAPSVTVQPLPAPTLPTVQLPPPVAATMPRSLSAIAHVLPGRNAYSSPRTLVTVTVRSAR